jgi:hypothetical protein
MSLTFPRSAAGLALLAALAAGCGTAAAAHHAGPAPGAMAHHHSAPMHAHSAPMHAHSAPMHAHSANPIPQGNGGDHDADNSGGPSDGDGNI